MYDEQIELRSWQVIPFILRAIPILLWRMLTTSKPKMGQKWQHRSNSKRRVTVMSVLDEEVRFLPSDGAMFADQETYRLTSFLFYWKKL